MIRALITAVALFSLIATAVVAPAAMAQEQPATIQTTGTGTASAPAVTAQLQILLGASDAFGMNGIAVEGTMMDVGPGTPIAAMPSTMTMSTTSLSEAQLTPVVDAIAGTGIEPDAIVATVPVFNSVFGPGSPQTGQIRVTVDQPQRDGLLDLVQTITTAAEANGLSVLYVGARYDAADCAALTQQAREAAIADANVRAEGLAEGLGVKLGALQQASETPYYGVSGLDTCAADGVESDFGLYGSGTEPVFDPDATEATITVQVMLTYTFTADA